MKNAELSYFAGWSAIVSAILTILGLVTLVMFFTLGEPWGTINDLSSVVLALFLIPVMFMLYRLLARDSPIFSLAAFVVAVLALLIAIVFQTLLVIRVIAFAQTAVIVPTAFGFFGAALMIYGFLALTDATLPRGLTWLSIIAGGGYILVVVGFILGGEEHPLTAIGGLTTIIFYPLWAMWFGRLLLSGKLNP